MSLPDALPGMSGGDGTEDDYPAWSPGGRFLAYRGKLRENILKDAIFITEPGDELLLGPVFAIPEALDQAGISLDDAGVVELHEAFAAQVLACLKLLADDEFCRTRLGRERAVGRVDPERLNAWGGSLAIGHPFGATGARLVATCAHRMRADGARYGVVATCAAGALGNAFVLERL